MGKTREAVARADALLREKLSPEQRRDFDRSQSFLVVTPAGRRYRLHADRVNFQADLLAPDSESGTAVSGEYVLASYCVTPRDSLIPKSDSLLAQMLLLLSDEALFLLTANVNPKVSSIHRYLSGEIRPRSVAPTPMHEPEMTTATPRARRVVGEHAQAEMAISATYRCAHHQEPVLSMRPSDDGRGWHVRYACDCPTQYVSFIAHQERERLLEIHAAARTLATSSLTEPIIRESFERLAAQLDGVQ